MSIVANHYAFVVGVDTHARTHTYAIISSRTGEVLGTKAFAVTDAAIDRAIAWTTSHTNGYVLFALEGSGSYGASLARSLRRGGHEFCDVRPPTRASRTRGRPTRLIL